MTPELLRCTAGEILEPLAFSFDDASGADYNLAGYTGKVTWYRHSSGATGEFAVTAVNGSTGEVSFDVPEALTATEDVVDLTIWAGNTDRRVASNRRWRLVIAAPAGTAPNI